MRSLKSLVRRLGLTGLARFILLRLLLLQRLLVRFNLINYSSMSYGTLVQMGNAALARSRHALALETYIVALSKRPEEFSLRVQIGVTCFLAGQYLECEKWFASSEQTKHFDISRWGIIEPQ